MRFSGFCRYALSGCVAAAMLAGCGGSQPLTSAPGRRFNPQRALAEKALKGYYLATFTTVVGSGPSSFCLRFMSSGSWSSTGGGGLSGTYLTSGKEYTHLPFGSHHLRLF